jgi:serine/threonine protein kinase
VEDQIGHHFTLLQVGQRGGGFSTVRKGVDVRDGSFVAVKFVTAQTDELTQKLFEREARTLKDLSHPNIVRYRASGIDETNTYYLVLDWVERDLHEVLKAGPWGSWDRLYKEIALPLVDALAYAHLKQIEHRDIKPQNVLVTDTGKPLLADFGIAKIRGDEAQTTSTVAAWHSRPYAPPEINSEIPYVRDVYSVGVLLLQCLTAETLRDLTDVERAVESVDVPPDVRRLLASCVATQPGDRPKNAGDLLGELARLQQSRVAKQALLRNPVWLRITRSAAESLAGDGDARAEAIAFAQADLSGDVFAWFFIDKESGEPSRDVVFLVGDSWRFKLKVDDDRSGAVITSASMLEFEALENHRRRALGLPRVYDWSFHKPANLAQAKSGLATLLDSIEEFYSDRVITAGTGTPEREGDDLFDTWLRVLDAREELARGEKEPLPYKQWRRKGREATFILTDPIDHDLINTEWRVKDKFTDHKYGFGEVVEHDGDRVVLLGSRWENLPAQGMLIPHIGPDEVALNRQRDAVMSVRNGGAARPDLRELLLDPAASSEPQRVTVSHWGRPLDEDKEKAVELALGAADIFLVQGPPGTGKTSFIAELVDQCLRAKPGARVLIASQTNVAVDNALERLDNGGQVSLVRLSSADTSRVDENVRHLLLDAQMKKWAQGVRKKAEANLSQRAETASVSADHLRAALALQQLAATISELERLQESQSASQELPEQTEFATALKEPASTSSIQEKVDALVDLRGELFAEAQTQLSGDLTLSPDIDAGDALNAVDALIGESSDAKGLLSRLRLQGEWLQRIASDSGLATTFLDQTSVIAGTCTGFLRHRAVRHLDIDICIVDEASRATLTEALVPVSRANRWIFVGDTNQLPPTDEDLLRKSELLNEHQLTREDVTQTLFQRLAEQLPSHSKLMLSQQYRMIRPIGDMISTCFYEGHLRSPQEEGLAGYVAAYGPPVLWIDTSSLGDKRRESAPQGQATSYANRGEAKVLIDRLYVLHRSIDKEVVKLKEGMDKLDVLVIAPYVSQVEELKQQLAPHRPRLKHLDVTVMSVDAVQGREADVALISVTRSNSKGSLGFLGPDYWRRINVALSRARYGLTIVGDAGFIKGTTGALKRVLAYVEEHPDDCAIRTAER